MGALGVGHCRFDPAKLAASTPPTSPVYSLRLSTDVVLQIRYDASGEPTCSVASDERLSRNRQIELSQLATAKLTQLRSEGNDAPVFELYSTLREELDAASEDEGEAIANVDDDTTAVGRQRAADQPDHLAICWAHHLLATSKRRDLVKWANELDIVGWAKPGYPGVMVAIGPADRIAEWVSRVKSLQWYALQVRSQDVVSPDARSRYITFLQAQGGLRNWREAESMSEATELADVCGVKAVFLEVLKIG